MKHCSGCETDKSASEFGKNTSRKDGLQTQCKMCRSSYGKSWYLGNTDLQKGRVKQRRLDYLEEVRSLLYEFLCDHACVDCGESDPVVLQFDHRGDKVFNVSDGPRKGLPIHKIEAEMAKCDVRCANCHVRKTAKDFNHFKWTRSQGQAADG